MEDYKFGDVGDQSTALRSRADLNQEADGYDMPPYAYSCALDSSFGGTRLEFPVGVALEVSLWCEYTRHCVSRVHACRNMYMYMYTYMCFLPRGCACAKHFVSNRVFLHNLMCRHMPSQKIQ